MLIVTVEPRPIVEPATGVSARTVPDAVFETTLRVRTRNPFASSALTAAGAFSPTTSGTASVRSEETESVTTERRVTSALGLGSWATTVPAAAELARVTTRATRPRRLSRATASCCFSRTTFGTLTVDALLPLSSRVSSQAASSPPSTSSNRSSSHGHRSGGRGGGGGGAISASSTTGGRSSTRSGPSSTRVASSRRRNGGPSLLIRSVMSTEPKPRTSRSRNLSISPTAA